MSQKSLNDNEVKRTKNMSIEEQHGKDDKPILDGKEYEPCSHPKPVFWKRMAALQDKLDSDVELLMIRGMRMEAKYLEDHLKNFLRHTGPCISPFNAWTLLKGLETLDLRVRRHAENALGIGKFLEAHGKVNRVLYPDLTSHPQHNLARRQMEAGGTVVSFEVPGGKEGAFAVLNALELIDISNNLGDAKSLATHPATTTHQRLSPEERDALGISDGLLRLSVGLEDVNDLTEDLDTALGKVA